MQRFISNDILKNSIVDQFYQEFLRQTEANYFLTSPLLQRLYDAKTRQGFKDFLINHLSFRVFLTLNKCHQNAFICSSISAFFYAGVSALDMVRVFEELCVEASQWLDNNAYSKMSEVMLKQNRALSLFRSREKVDLIPQAQAIWSKLGEIVVTPKVRRDYRMRGSVNPEKFFIKIENEYVQSLALALQLFTDLQPSQFLSPDTAKKLAQLLNEKLRHFSLSIPMINGVWPFLLIGWNKDEKYHVVYLKLSDYAKKKSELVVKLAWLFGDLLQEKFRLINSKLPWAVASHGLKAECINQASYFSLFPRDVIKTMEGVFEDAKFFNEIYEPHYATAQAKGPLLNIQHNDF